MRGFGPATFFTLETGMQAYKITRKSPFTGRVNEMTIEMRPEDWEEYTENLNRASWIGAARGVKPGRMIQDIFPYLTADEREFIKTGITPDEWPDEE